MASEFRGHVDEMVRQSELDQVKKQLESSISGVDMASLDPTREIKGAIQEGMAEGEKALAEAKSSLDNPPLDNPPLDNQLAEPESAPQVAAEPAAEPVAEPAHEDKPHEDKPHEDKPRAAAAG
jgi:sec-independent protein translocase protein TatB